MTDVDAPVLVVGAGPAGATAALLLARLGLASRVAERRDGPRAAPAAHVVNARTFEILRAAGVDMEAIAAACQDPADAGHVRWVTTLAGDELGALPYERQGDDVLALTPTPLRNLSQHRLEPILAAAVAGAGVDVAYGQEWIGATQDADGVTSSVRDRATGTVQRIRSRWLIAADGASSPVRQALGIVPFGPDRLQSFVMIHFEANLRPLVGARPAVLYWTTAPDAGGVFVAHEIDSTWVYMHPFDPEHESGDDYDPARCAAIVGRAMGTDAHPFTIRTVRTWTMTAQVAEHYRERRAFLVGDAAHRFPPTGGLGLNTGVQDVHNLVWKLAAVDAGRAPDALLDTYEIERRPVAERNADVSLRNALRLAEVYQALGSGDRAAVRGAIANQAEHFDMLGLQLGFTYRAGAVVPEPGEPPWSVREYVPTATPGARLPHAWVVRDGARVSTLDLVPYDRFAVVVGPAGDGWARAARAAGLACVRIGGDVVDDGGRWLALLGIAADGAVLVRPDQHVAWRARDAMADADEVLARILDVVMCRAGREPVVTAMEACR